MYNKVPDHYLLMSLQLYKRYDPTSSDELEFMENLFNCLCSSLMHNANKDLFLKGEGLQLMILMLRYVTVVYIDPFSCLLFLSHLTLLSFPWGGTLT